MRYLVFILLGIACGNAWGQATPVASHKSRRPYEKVITKDAIAWRGLFTVYQVNDSFFFEIPDTLLNRDMALINRYVQTPHMENNGFISRKYPGEETGLLMAGPSEAYYFTLGRDSSINLCKDDQTSQAAPGNRLATAVKQSETGEVVASFPVAAIGRFGKSYVVDAGNFLKTSSVVSSPDRAGKIDFHLEYVHPYPMNVEIGIYREDKEGNTIINTSFIALPKVPMQQRLFDRRIGFFTEKANYFSDSQQAAEKREYIVHWRLEPRPEDRERYQRGELVEPQKPIVIYIDPNTPKQWVKYLILGINDWQKAFEEAGFKNAIMGREWPYADSVSLNDARYSLVCYLPSETPNAYGPNIHDPRSGEIIQTHVGWYHNVMSLVSSWYRTQAGATDPSTRRPMLDDELMGQLIRFVSSHEVGHTLGLRHNFGSSSQTPVEKMRDKAWLQQHGHTASIMDYARFNYVAQPEDSIAQERLWPHIGEYDRWAIKWGYKYTGLSTEEDKKVLSHMATDSLAANPRLWFGSQEAEKQDPRAPSDDPRCQTEDLGDNNMTANAYGIKNLKRVLPNLAAWTKEQGGFYDNLGEAYEALLGEFNRFMGHVLHNIGGVERTYRCEDTGGDVYAPVSRTLQQQALAFLNEQLFTTPVWLLNPGVTHKVVVDMESMDAVSKLQRKILEKLLDYEIFGHLLANSSQFGENRCYPPQKYLADLHRYIWAGLQTGKPMDAYRRNLQKCYIHALTQLITIPNPGVKGTDIWSIARADLDQIEREVKKTLPKYRPGADQDHLKSVLYRIRGINNIH